MELGSKNHQLTKKVEELEQDLELSCQKQQEDANTIEELKN